MNKLIGYFKLTWERLKSKQNLYFNRMLYFGVGLGGLGLALALAGALVPVWVHMVSGYLVTIGITCGFVAKTTTKDAALTQKSEEFLKGTKINGEAITP